MRFLALPLPLPRLFLSGDRFYVMLTKVLRPQTLPQPTLPRPALAVASPQPTLLPSRRRTKISWKATPRASFCSLFGRTLLGLALLGAAGCDLFETDDATTSTSGPAAPSVSISVSPTSLRVAEDAVAGVVLGEVAVTVSDGSLPAISLEAKSPQEAPFTLDESGQIKLSGSLDYEAVAAYIVTVRVALTDPLQERARDFTIRVTDVPDVDFQVSATKSEASTPERSASGIELSDVDAEGYGDQFLQYELSYTSTKDGVLVAADADVFAIGAQTGKIRTGAAALDYEQADQHVLTATVTLEPDGSTRSVDVVVNVTNVQLGSEEEPYWISTLDELQSLATGFQNSYLDALTVEELAAIDADLTVPLSPEETMRGHYELAADIDASATAALAYDGGGGEVLLPVALEGNPIDVGTSVADGDPSISFIEGCDVNAAETCYCREGIDDKRTPEPGDDEDICQACTLVENIGNDNLGDGTFTCNLIHETVVGGGFFPIGSCGTDNACGTATDELGADGDLAFKGSLRGGGYEVRGLAIRRPAQVNQGLFAYVGSGAVLEDLVLTNVDIVAEGSVGAVAANLGGTLRDSIVTGRVFGAMNGVGGLVGYSRASANISRCFTAMNVNLDANAGFWVGGLVGNNGGIISDSFGAGIVHGDSNVGGIVGSSLAPTYQNFAGGVVDGKFCVGGVSGAQESGASLRESFFKGSSRGDSWIGAIVGLNEGAIVQNTYAFASVHGDSFVGGTVGQVDSNSEIEDNYAASAVTFDAALDGDTAALRVRSAVEPLLVAYIEGLPAPDSDTLKAAFSDVFGDLSIPDATTFADVQEGITYTLTNERDLADYPSKDALISAIQTGCSITFADATTVTTIDEAVTEATTSKGSDATTCVETAITEVVDEHMERYLLVDELETAFTGLSISDGDLARISSVTNAISYVVGVADDVGGFAAYPVAAEDLIGAIEAEFAFSVPSEDEAALTSFSASVDYVIARGLVSAVGGVVGRNRSTLVGFTDISARMREVVIFLLEAALVEQTFETTFAITIPDADSPSVTDVSSGIDYVLNDASGAVDDLSSYPIAKADFIADLETESSLTISDADADGITTLSGAVTYVEAADGTLTDVAALVDGVMRDLLTPVMEQAVVDRFKAEFSADATDIDDVEDGIEDAVFAEEEYDAFPLLTKGAFFDGFETEFGVRPPDAVATEQGAVDYYTSFGVFSTIDRNYWTIDAPNEALSGVGSTAVDGRDDGGTYLVFDPLTGEGLPVMVGEDNLGLPLTELQTLTSEATVFAAPEVWDFGTAEEVPVIADRVGLLPPLAQRILLDTNFAALDRVDASALISGSTATLDASGLVTVQNEGHTLTYYWVVPLAFEVLEGDATVANTPQSVSITIRRTLLVDDPNTEDVDETEGAIEVEIPLTIVERSADLGSGGNTNIVQIYTDNVRIQVEP